MNKEEISKIDKIICSILLLIASSISKYSKNFYAHQIDKIKEEILKGDNND